MDSRPSRKRLTNVKSVLGINAVGLLGQKGKLVTDMSQSATDDLVHLLAHQYRREVLDALVDTSSSAPVDQCLSWDFDSQDSFEECSRHLDMLERANVIEYDESGPNCVPGAEIRPDRSAGSSVLPNSRPPRFLSKTGRSPK